MVRTAGRNANRCMLQRKPVTSEEKVGKVKKLLYRQHAEMRMRQRNITDAEVQETLGQPKHKHFYNPERGTMNVRHYFRNIGLSVLVAYVERADEIEVVTVIEE